MVATLDGPVESVGSGGIGQRLELVERPLRFLGIGVAEDRSDQDRALAFGTGCVRAIGGGTRGGQVTSFLSRSTPSWRRSSARVSENRTKPSPVGP